jgi:hypothetical protein
VKNIGILVHGRHLQAKGWEDLVWGEPPHWLGTLPMAVLTILNQGVENIRAVVFGTGASERDGLKESEQAYEYLKRRWNTLSDFGLIERHPRFRRLGRNLYNILFETQVVHLDTETLNTTEEIAAAARVFATENITEVYQITCASHAPRCARESAIAFARGDIPKQQIWSVVPDRMPYIGTAATDVVVIEPPHRGDDPMMDAPIQAHRVFAEFYKIPSLEKKMDALRAIDIIISDAKK